MRPKEEAAAVEFVFKYGLALTAMGLLDAVKKTAGPALTTEMAKVALTYLNQAAERQFRHTPENLRIISKRIESVGGDLVGVKVMIDRQCALWKGDPRMEMYLRPETLFNQKFNSYYDDRNLPIPGLVRLKPHHPPEQNQLRENISIRPIEL